MNVLVAYRELLLLDSLVASLKGRLSQYNFYKTLVLQDPLSDKNIENIQLFVLDLDLIGLNSLSKIKKLYPDSKILIISSQLNRDFVSICKSIGVNGYFTKRIDIDSLVDAISLVIKSDLFVCSEWFSLQPKLSDIELTEVFKGVQNLSSREVDTLKLSIEGLNTREIAKKMNIEPKSIENYKNRINKKINMNKSSSYTYFIIKNKNLISFLVRN